MAPGCALPALEIAGVGRWCTLTSTRPRSRPGARPPQDSRDSAGPLVWHGAPPSSASSSSAASATWAVKDARQGSGLDATVRSSAWTQCSRLRLLRFLNKRRHPKRGGRVAARRQALLELSHEVLHGCHCHALDRAQAPARAADEASLGWARPASGGKMQSIACGASNARIRPENTRRTVRVRGMPIPGLCTRRAAIRFRGQGSRSCAPRTSTTQRARSLRSNLKATGETRGV